MVCAKGLYLPCINMKILLVIIIIFHGLIHLLGFLKAFDFAQIPALSIKTIILVSASGVFTISKTGDIKQFAALRYYEQNGDFSLEKWVINCHLHQEMKGIRIPVRSTVTWGLKSGDFNWLKLDITEVNYSYQ